VKARIFMVADANLITRYVVPSATSYEDSPPPQLTTGGGCERDRGVGGPATSD